MKNSIAPVAILVLVFAVSSATFSQPSTDEVSESAVLHSGTPQSWTAEEINLRYNVPEPVGQIELTMRIARQSGPYSQQRITDRFRLVSGSISYGDKGTIDLQTSLLGCLPLPRPREIGLTILYITPEDSQTEWFDTFTSYVTVPYGPPRLIPDDVGVGRYVGYASVEIAVTGRTIRRALFRKATGEERAFSPIQDSCPGELIEWALEAE